MKYLALSFFLLINTFLKAQSPPDVCLHFNGKQTAVGPLTTTSQTFSLAFSFKTTSVLPPSQGMSRMLCWNNNDQSRLEIGLINGKLTGFFYDLSAHSTADVLRSNVFVADGKWHHVTLLSNSDNAEWRLDDQILFRLGGPLTPGTSLRLGAWYNGEYFTGCLDNVRLSTWPGTAPLAEYTFEQGVAGGDNRQLTALPDATGRFPLQLNGFILQGETANFVDAAAPMIAPAPPPRQRPVRLPPPDGKNGSLRAKQFAVLDGNLLLFTPGEEDWLQMDFIGLISQKIKNEGLPISDRAFIEIDTIQVTPEEMEDYQRQSVRRLKKQSDAAFWQQLSGGTFMYRDDDERLQLLEVGSAHRAVSANYRPLALSLGRLSEVEDTMRFMQQNQHLLFHDGFQQWRTDDYETYTVVLLHLNKTIPFALLFDENDGEYCGYIIVTSEGPQLGLVDRCTGVNCGWTFVKMPQPQYAKWALGENWQLEEQFDTIPNGGHLSVQHLKTGQILVPSAKSVDIYPSCLAVQMPNGHYHLYDGLGRLVYPKGKNDPAIRALDARWASGAGVRVLIENQFYWWTLTGGIRPDEHPPLPVVEVCGTVDYYTDSLVQTAGQWEIRCHKEGTATAAHAETYVLPALSSDQVPYVHYTFLTGEQVLRYAFSVYWGGDHETSLYQPVIARRADQRCDLLRLETGPNRLLQKVVLLEKADWVQNMHYNAQILFKKEGLLGVFPGMTEGKFTDVQPFEYFFARITMPNGRKGWLNMQGDVYLDEH
jgi:hypothetical protein